MRGTERQRPRPSKRLLEIGDVAQSRLTITHFIYEMCLCVNVGVCEMSGYVSC